MAEGALDRIAAVEVAADGAVTYRASQLAPPSDAFCNVAFARAAGTYFVPAYASDRSGRQSILTLDAATGALLHNAPTSIAVDVPAMAFDDASKLLYGVGFEGDDGYAHVWSIDPVTGATTEIGKAATQDDIQLCEAAFSPPTAAMPLGALIFLWTPKSEGASDAVVLFDVAKGAVAGNFVHDKGGLNSLSVWTPPGGGGGYELLAMSFLNTRPMELVSIVPGTGASRVLLTLPAEDYVPCQGAQAFAEDTGTVWVALGYNDPTNRSYYPVLLEINATASPATMQQHWLDEKKAPGGIWALSWMPGA